MTETLEDAQQIAAHPGGSPKDAWNATSFDLSSSAGQVAGLMFSSKMNEVNPISLNLDDVVIQE